MSHVHIGDHCGPMVLDALTTIHDQIDPTLSFRRSHREGVSEPEITLPADW